MSYHHTDEWTGTPVRRSGFFMRVVRGIIAGLDALHRAQFETPWRQGAGQARR